MAMGKSEEACPIGDARTDDDSQRKTLTEHHSIIGPM